MERSPKRNPYAKVNSSRNSGSSNRSVQPGSSRYSSGNYGSESRINNISRESDRGVRSQNAQRVPVHHNAPGHAESAANRTRSTSVRAGSSASKNAPANRRTQRPSSGSTSRHPAKKAHVRSWNAEKLFGFARENSRLLFLAGMAILLVLLVILIVSLIKPDQKNLDLPAEVPVQAAEQTVMPVETPVPTAAPTPTPVPTPRPTMVSDYQVLTEKSNTDKALGVAECPRVDDSYFNDTVFVGDSVSMKLAYFVKAERKTNPNLLGNARFFTAQNFSARNALRDVTETSIHPTYQGQKMKLEDVIAAIAPKRVYIMLGMNDVGVIGVDKAVTRMGQLLKVIKEKSPDVQIFVQSATPRVKGSRPTTQELFEYNIKLYEQIMQLTEHDIWFVDVAYTMRDENGKLYENYCSDLDGMALHFTNQGCRAWIEYLYTHALP